MSQVRLTLDEPEPGVTVVKLTHTDIPEEDRCVSFNVIVKILVLAICVKFCFGKKLVSAIRVNLIASLSWKANCFVL